MGPLAVLGVLVPGPGQMWLVGNLALVATRPIVAVTWKHEEEARQRRVDERADAVAAVGR